MQVPFAARSITVMKNSFTPPHLLCSMYHHLRAPPFLLHKARRLTGPGHGFVTFSMSVFTRQATTGHCRPKARLIARENQRGPHATTPGQLASKST